LPLTKRPVHIFYGRSNTCKSYIATLTGKVVFETDSVTCVEELPDKLPHDIIVIGNRWKCDIVRIEERLVGDVDAILVEFK
tara:strand:+ start:1364 stop:1606 length:243 start_codon:yes stop_codon:yes gene_type:complete